MEQGNECAYVRTVLKKQLERNGSVFPCPHRGRVPTFQMQGMADNPRRCGYSRSSSPNHGPGPSWTLAPPNAAAETQAIGSAGSDVLRVNDWTRSGSRRLH
jgi:hypothetical protein